jgi:pimeloyl-ACP methyl ester carboxylesterase
MFHGMNSGTFSFVPIIKKLLAAENNTVYLLSLPGFGMSGPEKGDLSALTMNELLQFYKSFFNETLQFIYRHDKWILIGHSFGGFLLADYFRGYPNTDCVYLYYYCMYVQYVCGAQRACFFSSLVVRLKLFACFIVAYYTYCNN